MDVLIADDDPINRKVLEANLAKWGHGVISCTDGDQAWDVLQSPETPKLAVLDWMMPGVEGPELCRRVRELNHGQLMHIILLTARNEREDLIAGLQAGANDYVTKPFDREELHARLSVGLRVLDLQERLIDAERYRLLTQTAGAAAHEINQPLTALLGNLDLLLYKLDEDDPIRANLNTVRTAGQRITEIVRQMQDIRKVATKPYIDGIEIIDFDGSSE